jgi:NAD+ synthase (glutamine-hydrolysing)
VKIALGQINTTIGDFTGNTHTIQNAATRARREGAELIVFPELSLCGYPPMDLLDDPSFVDQTIIALDHLQKTLPPDIAVVVGYVDRTQGSAEKALQNVAAVVLNGKVVFRQAKRLLPTYDVFDEARYFQPGSGSAVWEYRGYRIGIAICEDIWWDAQPAPGIHYPVDPVKDLLAAGANLILAPSASPFYTGKAAIRRELISSIGRTSGVPVVYVNAVGANDSLIFDGTSMVTDSRGELVHRLPSFTEETRILGSIENPVENEAVNRSSTNTTSQKPVSSPVNSSGKTISQPSVNTLPDTSKFAGIEGALVLGIRDYLRKTGFTRVSLGLSGGIDSAVVAVLAARAAGPENVTVFLMPSQYSSGGSVTDSEELAANLGVRAVTLPIEPLYQAFIIALEGEFAGTKPGLAEENIQARARGNLLMAWSNKFGSLTLACGNKSELAVGYCTLYGDMVGSLSVIGDLLKTEVWELARYLNRDGEVIPEAIITKPPSAELRPGQNDQDSLPPYEVLDAILTRRLIGNETASQIVAAGYDGDTVGQVLQLLSRSEYKRRQAAPVLKVSPRAFGTGRRVPMARKIHEVLYEKG